MVQHQAAGQEKPVVTAIQEQLDQLEQVLLLVERLLLVGQEKLESQAIQETLDLQELEQRQVAQLRPVGQEKVEQLEPQVILALRELVLLREQQELAILALQATQDLLDQLPMFLLRKYSHSSALQ